MKSLKIITFMLFFLVACAQKPIIWDRTGTTQEQFNRDNGECYQMAQVYTPPRNTPQPQGQMVGGYYVAPSWSQQLGAALNNSPGGYSTNQNQYIGCMQSRGYSPRR